MQQSSPLLLPPVPSLLFSSIIELSQQPPVRGVQIAHLSGTKNIWTFKDIWLTINISLFPNVNINVTNVFFTQGQSRNEKF